MLHVGIDHVEGGIAECPVPDGNGRFRGAALSLVVCTDMVADLRPDLTADHLHGQAAVTDHLAGFLQTHSPKAKAEDPVPLPVPGDLVPEPGLAEGVGVTLHDVRIRLNTVRGIKIVLRHLPQDQSLRLDHHRFSSQTRFAETIIPRTKSPHNKKSPHSGRKQGIKMTLDLLVTQDQGSSIVDGINHLHNLILSIDFALGELA